MVREVAMPKDPTDENSGFEGAVRELSYAGGPHVARYLLHGGPAEHDGGLAPDPANFIGPTVLMKTALSVRLLDASSPHGRRALLRFWTLLQMLENRQRAWRQERQEQSPK